MKKIPAFCIVVFVLLCNNLVFGQEIERFSGNNSVDYESCIAQYAALADESDQAILIEMGKTDVGKPLHLFIIDQDGKFYPGSFDSDKVVLLINNGIHPGEPCGIDASLKLAKDLLTPDSPLQKLLKHTVVCIVPVYNIGGALNRGCCSRANQNGPEAYGFRGNARNLDLNRDFIKNDSKNAQSFTRIFQVVKPHAFLDTHTSNGADYQYTMTMIVTQPDKLEEGLRKYIREDMSPALYESMANKGWEMTPYVHTVNRVPEKGIMDYLETPRYSTGYTALFNTLGFTSETHMFKPFADRVESTYQFEVSLLEYMATHAKELKKLRAEADERTAAQQSFDLQWKLDTTVYQEISFKGYQANFEQSNLTGKERLSYDRNNPWTRTIKYFDHFQSVLDVEKPDFYLLPQCWSEVADRLLANGVFMEMLPRDTTLIVEAYHIVNYETATRVYEGHYLHYGVEVEKVEETLTFYKGDFLIPTNQAANNYLVHVLEPQGVDSYFAWNFFDSILQQKEWFSDYVFEEKAEELLSGDDDLRHEFEQKKKEDESFSDNHWQMLYWLYQHSDYFEKSLNRYPVYRIESGE